MSNTIQSMSVIVGERGNLNLCGYDNPMMRSSVTDQVMMQVYGTNCVITIHGVSANQLRDMAKMCEAVANHIDPPTQQKQARGLLVDIATVPCQTKNQ